MGQVWAVNSRGGHMHALNLSKKLRFALQPETKFRQMCDVKDASQQGKHKGEKFHWDVFLNIASQGGTLVETTVMPEHGFTIAQGTLVITEYGHAIPWSSKLDYLSELDLTPVVRKTLKNDAVKAFDSAAHTQFDLAPLRVVGTTSSGFVWSSNGTASKTNTGKLTKTAVREIVLKMKEKNIDPFIQGDYASIAWPTTYRTLGIDLEGIHTYTPQGLKMIMNGEMGRYSGCRFVEQTNIGKGVSNTTAWTKSKSDWAFFFGGDTAMEAICVPEEVRRKIPTDYGRSHGMGWYYLGGFGCARPYTNAQLQPQATIVKWDSAV